jgi:hypothetical protein
MALRVRYKGGVRSLVYAALLLSAVALAGCNGSDESSSDGDQATWSADHLVDLDDATLVTEFNAYAETVDEQWERAPVTVVAEMLRLDSSDNPNVSVVSEAPAEAADEATVTVTYSRLLDDSVEATQHVVELGLDGEVWQVERVASSFSCKPGRGHQGFSNEPCV